MVSTAWTEDGPQRTQEILLTSGSLQGIYDVTPVEDPQSALFEAADDLGIFGILDTDRNFAHFRDLFLRDKNDLTILEQKQ